MATAKTTISSRSARRRLEQVIGRRLNIHHLVHPKNRYRKGVEKTYRDLHCLRVVMDIDEHKELHHKEGPPPTPDHREMERRIRECDNRGCSSQGCTQPIRFVTDDPELLAVRLPSRLVISPSSSLYA